MANKKTQIAPADIVYATAESLLGIRGPQPLSEDYTHPKTGLTIHIEGLKGFRDKVSAGEMAAEMARRINDGKLIVRDSANRPFKPKDNEVEMVIMASKCVTEPKLNEMQWFAILAESEIVYRIYERILICNRDLSESDLKQLSGIDEAKETLEQSPLSEIGTPSA